MSFAFRAFIWIVKLINFGICSKHNSEPITPSRIEEIKRVPVGSPSPTAPITSTATPQDRSAMKRAEMRKLEQERRRREAVSSLEYLFHPDLKNINLNFGKNLKAFVDKFSKLESLTFARKVPRNSQ